VSRENRAQELNNLHIGGVIDYLGIRFEIATKERVTASMSVGKHNHQPSGILHGGVSVTLAETLASTGAFLNVDPATHYVVGLEINANHIRAKREGKVFGEAIPLHIGRTTQIWEIKIRDEEEKLVCVSRCTMAVIARDR
jgi:1,4-dihydroxy-2-naphthoyl-CoA hydrolase